MVAKQPQREGKILLVDDDPGLLRLLSIRLRAEGYDVEAVESAHKALGALRHFSPDLVVTDLMMPVMGGGEILDWVCKKDIEITSFVISSSPFEDVMKHIKDKGAFAYIPKPFRLNHLSHMVKTALNRSRLHG